MKISIEKLGVFEKTELDIGDLTILCGENNTGKTYVTYALYGFLDFWGERFMFPVKEKWASELLDTGECKIKKTDLFQQFSQAWKKACEAYVQEGVLAECFGGDKARFKEVFFEATLPPITPNFSKIDKIELLQNSKKGNETNAVLTICTDDPESLTISLTNFKHTNEKPIRLVNFLLSSLLKAYTYPVQPFIISAERTGIAIFRNELDFARTKALEYLTTKGKEPTEEFDLFKFITQQYNTDYPKPVKDNVEFARQIEGLSKGESWLAKEHPDVLKEFNKILGGTYKINKAGSVQFVPKKKIGHLSEKELNMNDSSGAVRSLLQLRFYLYHIAKKQDFLIIDEPELNLHPANQRLMARLLAKLVNLGFKIFVTTHSDYLVRELNTLLMLKGEAEHLKKIAKKNGYTENELLTPDQIRLYTARLDTTKKTTKGYCLEQAKITSEYGIEAKTFDSTIDEMNKIQESILFGGDE
jgi:hypothetical protein